MLGVNSGWALEILDSLAHYERQEQMLTMTKTGPRNRGTHMPTSRGVYRERQCHGTTFYKELIQIKVATRRYESSEGKLGQLAMVEVSAGIEGVKKYSPPFGTTKSGSVNVLSCTM